MESKSKPDLPKKCKKKEEVEKTRKLRHYDIH
jgi:hypothetical protein